MANKAVTAKSKSAPETPASKAPWPLVRFGDMVRDVKANVDRDTTELTRFVAGEHMDSEDVHLRRWGDLNGDYLGPAFHRGFRKGQVLYGSRRTYLKKVAVAPFDGICANTTFVLESKDTEMLLPELLPFIMLTDAFTQHSIRESKGSVNPYINWKDIAKYQFPLPPKDEQRRIADILWSVDEALEKWRSMYHDLKNVKKAIVVDMFRNGLRNEPKKPSIMGIIPKSWDIVRLNEAAEFLDGRRIPLKDADRAKRKGPYPYYGASGIIDHVDDFIFDESIILLSEDGFNLVHRNSPIAFRVDGKCWVNNHAHVLKPCSRIDINLLVEYLESLSLEPYITGTYQRKLNKSACEAIPVPIPSADEQEIMTRTLNSFADALAVATSHAENVRTLRSDLTQSLFGAGNVH